MSILYVQEIALFLSRVRRMVIAAVLAASVLMVTSILALAGLSQGIEEIMPFEEELGIGLVLLVLIIPAAAYFAIRSTRTMDQWRDRLDSLMFALRFESKRPEGQSASVRLANQAIYAMGASRDPGKSIEAKDLTNSKLGTENYDVVVPDQVTRMLTGKRGAVVVKRIEGKTISVENLASVLEILQSSGARISRFLVVSDRELPAETLSYHASIMAKRSGFLVDLVEETPLGFSVVSLGH